MSFSSDTKIELSKISNLKNEEEVYAELYGYLTTINVKKITTGYKFSTENEYNINRFTKLLANVNINNYKIEIQGKTYVVTFKLKGMEKITQNIDSDEAKKSFIRGAFLGGGYINNPENKYHLDIIFKKFEFAKFVIQLLKDYNISSKLLEKEKEFTVYIKEGEQISKFLALIGASNTVLKFESERVMREMKNNVNRIVNCETANINKTIDASVEQISNIKKLKESGKFEKMSDDVKELANLRLKNPNDTLEELGRKLKRPVGRATVYYRFKKMKEELEN